ncbi:MULTISPECIES: RNA polymerase sigma factor [Anaerolinea]|uniref:RNA polymerase sigma factor n=1 Tax=Anaerolinea TaxID=233189 RepID=UPI0026263AEC|nr:sigma-70 family RNA polymerase sigma factor [Anaerolinea thermophila]
MDESILLEKARAFDLDALAEVYDRYSPPIYRYALRLLGDEVLAEECVADTFHRFLLALRNGGGPENHLQAYLYRVAHNWITDTFRRNPARWLEESDGESLSDPAMVESIEAQVHQRLEQNRVRRALRALTPDQRQVVVLKFLEGWENESIARAIGKPVGAVKSLQHRALASLRRFLDMEGKE